MKFSDCTVCQIYIGLSSVLGILIVGGMCRGHAKNAVIGHFNLLFTDKLLTSSSMFCQTIGCPTGRPTLGVTHYLNGIHRQYRLSLQHFMRPPCTVIEMEFSLTFTVED